MYAGNWAEAENPLEEIKDEFEITDAELEGVEILYAAYETPGYEGWAFVLFRKDGKLYEVNGAHCSCCGLEDQWQPEEADLKELFHRATEGGLCRDFPGVLEVLNRRRGEATS